MDRGELSNEQKRISRDIERRLQRLRTIPDTQIKDLGAGEFKEDFNFITTQVSLLYDTDAYERMMVEPVKRIFGDLENITLGTVGAYFRGCFVDVDIPNGIPKNCAAICAGSMPPPKGTPDWSFCSNRVFVVTSTPSGNHFRMLSEGDGDRDSAIIQTEVSDIKFSDRDKEYLKNLGIQRVTLMKYSSDGRSYTILLNNVPVDQLPGKSSGGNGGNSGTGWFWIIGIIAAFLFLLLILFGCRRKRLV